MLKPRSLARLFWVMGSLAIASLVAFPLLYIIAECLSPPTENWRQLTEKDPSGLLDLLPPELREEVMPEHTLFTLRLRSTLIVLAGTLLLGSLTGITLAWLLSAYAIPFRKTLTLFLALPLAIPSYIMAAGFKLLTDDWSLTTAIRIRELYGGDAMRNFDEVWKFTLAIGTLSCAFFPYIFLAARTAFGTLSTAYLDASKTLGYSLSQSFRKIALPLARPAILGGITLAALETLNEYGAMKIIGIQTLLTEIFKVRSGANDLNTAVRLAGTIMTIVFVLLLLEMLLRGRKKYHAARSSGVETTGATPSRIRVATTWLASLGIVTVSFVLPVYALLRESSYAPVTEYLANTLAPALDSLQLTAASCALMLFLAFFLCLAQRCVPGKPLKVITRISTLGYAVPGAILGVAILSWTGSTLQNPVTADITKWIFYSSCTGLVLAYGIRYLTVAIHPLEAGYENIPTKLDDASRTLNRRFPVTIFRLHLPLLRPSILAALLIMTVDVIKELPLTLILAPFNTNTLAMHTYSMFAVQEDYPRAAIPALVLVSTCTICIISAFAFLKPMDKTRGSSRSV